MSNSSSAQPLRTSSISSWDDTRSTPLRPRCATPKRTSLRSDRAVSLRDGHHDIPSPIDLSGTPMSTSTFPALFVSHGGGPWPFMDGWRELYALTAKEFKEIPGRLPEKPKAI